MSIIEQIRAEIERRMVELAKDKYIDLHDTLCRTKELNRLLSFLDTLKEQPVELEKEIEGWFNRLDNKYCRNVEEYYGNDIEDTARHFYNLGRGSSEKSNDHKGFPTTDEEMEEFLKNTPPVELPDKYKTPDWLFKQAKSEIPTNLDEAAKKYASEQEFYWIRENPYTSQEYAFKAGAVWDREQGLIFNTCINNSGHLSIPMGINLPIGEDVVVQIRKKDE